MARRYVLNRANVTPNTTDDLLTIKAAASKVCIVKRIRLGGLATASTKMRTIIRRSSGGTTPGGAATPMKTNSSDGAAETSGYTTWATQPTLDSTSGYEEAWNAFGGGFDLTLDGREIVLVNAEQLSIRQAEGTGALNLDVEIEEW